ncbi:hypothetical protein C1N66_31105 (plasmid) [Bacillus cereus]|uniref:IrrE N-terminal-like domain-containing protein n=1 Tax=Bacillus cereus TaxID=1396 RepID=A0AB73UTR1_BACCE|nr:hypothetical protein [Bacillus cereus]QHV08006.1 hypothetical protein C1N82_32970 [Bacillus cereus]QHV47466.1 hypothetical protein C1N66_31105 [Bacillus cereus]
MNITPYEKIKQRIINDDIKIVQKNSYGAEKYSCNLILNSHSDVVERHIIKPMFPEISNEEQAFSLAHELGHHQLYAKRSKLLRIFFSNVRSIKSLKLITFPFVIYDEYKAWKNAKYICEEEQILASFETNFLFEQQKQFALKKYWMKYINDILNTIQYFFCTYIWCILFVLFLQLTYQSKIHIPLLYELQEIVGGEENKNNCVTVFYYLAILVIVGVWLLNLIRDIKINIDRANYKRMNIS